MSAIPSREITSTQVGGISFGFYSDDEVKFHDVCTLILLQESFAIHYYYLTIAFCFVLLSSRTSLCDLRSYTNMTSCPGSLVRNTCASLTLLLHCRSVSLVSSRSLALSFLTTSKTLLLEACMIRPWGLLSRVAGAC